LGLSLGLCLGLSLGLRLGLSLCLGLGLGNSHVRRRLGLADGWARHGCARARWRQIAKLFELLDTFLVGHQGCDQLPVVGVDHPACLRNGDDQYPSEQQQAEHEAGYGGHITWPDRQRIAGQFQVKSLRCWPVTRSLEELREVLQNPVIARSAATCRSTRL
jgi:hypothetical protein